VQCTAALVNRESFSIETTFSGNTERVLIATAKASGYEVTMTYIALNDVAKNVWPVEKPAQWARAFGGPRRTVVSTADETGVAVRQYGLCSLSIAVFDALILEAIVAASAVPLAVGTAIAVRRRAVAPAPPLPSRRAMGALVARLPHRHRREAKGIVALARDHEKRHSPSRLDAFTAREALRSYLPETINAYLGVPKDLRGRSRGGRPSPDQELARQLLTLRSGLERLRDGDADIAATRMAENQSFLHERFGTPAAHEPIMPPTIVERLGNLIDDFLRGG